MCPQGGRTASVLSIGLRVWLCLFYAEQVIATTRVVRNDEDTHRKSLRLLPELVVGSEDGDETQILGRVWGVGVSSTLDIYILDKSFNHVRQFDSLGVYQRTIGRSGEGPGELAYPFAITVDRRDRLYVADRSKIVIFDHDGKYLGQFPHKMLSSVIRSIKVDAGGNVFVSCFDVFERLIIHKFNDKGIHVASFCDSYAAGQDVDVRIERTLAGGAIDIDDQGLIVFTQMTPYEIRTFSADGSPVMTIQRANQFGSPDVGITEGGLRVGPVTGSFSIVCLGNGMLLNVVKNVVKSSTASSDDDRDSETILDLFDRDGILVATRRLTNTITPKCADRYGRLYAIDEEDFPRVVRYRVVVE